MIKFDIPTIIIMAVIIAMMVTDFNTPLMLLIIAVTWFYNVWWPLLKKVIR